MQQPMRLTKEPRTRCAICELIHKSRMSYHRIQERLIMQGKLPANVKGRLLTPEEQEIILIDQGFGPVEWISGS